MPAGGVWALADSAHVAGDACNHCGLEDSVAAPGPPPRWEGRWTGARWGERRRFLQESAPTVLLNRGISLVMSPTLLLAFFFTRFAASALHLDSGAQGSFACVFK